MNEREQLEKDSKPKREEPASGKLPEEELPHSDQRDNNEEEPYLGELWGE